MSNSDGETGQNVLLALVFGLVAIVVGLVIGIALHHTAQNRAATQGTLLAVVTETVAVVIPDGASIRIDGGTVNFYFASNSTDLAPGAAEALAVVIKGVEDGRQAVVAGFHDTTGDADFNADLAKRRAQAVRDVLVGLGVPDGQITLRQPAVTTGSGSDAQARRVEVRLVE